MEQVLARMFFESSNGPYIETRPLDWVEFTTSEDFCSQVEEDKDRKKFESELDKRLVDGKEVYVAFTDKLLGIQFYKGVFTNVWEQRKHGNTRRSSR